MFWKPLAIMRMRSSIYKSAIEVNPNIPMLHMELGRNLRFVQVYDEAIDEFTHRQYLESKRSANLNCLISRTYATNGEYAKALQYAEAAVKDRPTDPALRGNYGVMYYRNFQYTEAVQQLSLAVNGGKTENGLPIQGLPLTNDPRIAEYYYTYGLGTGTHKSMRAGITNCPDVADQISRG